MSRKWSVAEAKAKFSRVLADAKEEAQAIQNRGVDVAVVLDADTYRALLVRLEETKPSERLKRFLRASEAIRSQGGAEIHIAKRRSRPSPLRERKR
jgi:prevent-host-death family protein